MSAKFLATYKGVVLRTNDPQFSGRVILSIPQILGSAESAWASPSTPTTAVPKVGDVVYVTFNGGDISYPVYVPAELSDGSVPKQPTGLTLTTMTSHTPDGITLADVTATWTAPTENQDGSVPVDLGGYTAQYSFDGETWSGGQFTMDPLTTFHSLTAGGTIYVRVASLSHANRTSLFSSGQIATTTSPAPAGTVLGDLQTDVGTAQSTADGKNKAIFATTGPGATANTAGDLWFQQDADKNVTAMWVGAGGTSWLSYALRDEVVASLTGGKIVAGTIDTSRLALGVLRTNLVPNPCFEENLPVPEWLPADTSTAHLWRKASAPSTSVSRQPNKSRSGAWALDLYVDAAGATAETYTPTMTLKAGTKYKVLVNAVSVGVQAKLDVQVLYGSSSTTVSTANVMSQTVVTPLTSVPQAATIPVKSTEYGRYAAEITPAAGQEYVVVRVRNLNPGGQSSLCIDDISIVEMGGGGATEVTAAGLRLFDGNGEEVGAFVSNRSNYFTVTDPSKGVVASVGDDGSSTWTSVTSGQDMTVKGFPLLGEFAGHNATPSSGAKITGWLDMLPRGLAGFGVIGGSTAYSGTNIARREIAFLAEPGRSYRVSFGGTLCTMSTANVAAGFYLGLATPASPGGDAAGVAAGAIMYSYSHSAAASGYTSLPAVSRVLRANKDGKTAGGELNYGWNRIILFSSGTFTTDSAPFDITVEDIGPDVPDNDVANSTGSGTAGARASYVTVWDATDSESYTEAGVARTEVQDLYNGYYSAEKGNQYAHVLFNGNGISGQAVSVATAMSGATLKKAEVRVYCKSAPLSRGFGSVMARGSTGTVLSSTKNTGAYVNPGVRSGQATWIDVTSIWDGTMRSLSLGPAPTTNGSQYVLLADHTAGADYRPQLRLTYDK